MIAFRRERAWVTAVYVGARLLPVVAIGALVLFGTRVVCERGERTMTEAERMQERVLFVRMPGRPDVCVAALRGVRGYGPTFLGAARCAEVRDRVAFDEDISFRLGQAAVVRIGATGACLAYVDGAERFTLPCGPDD